MKQGSRILKNVFLRLGSLFWKPALPVASTGLSSREFLAAMDQLAPNKYDFRQ